MWERSVPRRALLALLACFGAAACDGSGPALPGADAGVDSAAPALTVVVSATSPAPLFGRSPAAGAVVALDAPGGGRVEKTADAEGRVRFDATEVDWSLGAAAVTAYLEGQGLVSRVGVTAADGEVELGLAALDWADDLVSVSGTASGMQSAAEHYLQVSATVPHLDLSDIAPGPGWELKVPADTPFTLVAFELAAQPCTRCIDNPIFGWVVSAPLTFTSAATVPLDFTAAVTPTRVAGSFTMPGRPASPLRRGTICFMTTSAAGDNALVGRATSARVTADGATCEYEAEYVEVPGATAPATLYSIFNPGTSDGAYSYVEVPGYVAAGPQALAFVDLPELTRLPETLVGSPLEWQSFDTGVTPKLALMRAGSTVWRVEGALDATAIAVPPPPTAVDPAALLGADDLTAQLLLCRREAPSGGSVACALGPIFELVQ